MLLLTLYKTKQQYNKQYLINKLINITKIKKKKYLLKIYKKKKKIINKNLKY